MFGQRLKMARKKAGFSLQDLSKRMSPAVSAQAISKYESGKMMPSSSALVSLGRALNTSLDFLMGGQIAELEGVEFRKHSATSVQDRARAEAIVTEKIEDYLSIEDILGFEAPADPFGNLRSTDLKSLEDVEDKAKELRKKWKLGNDPIPSMTGLLEEKGIKVIEADLPERFDGLTCKVKRSGGNPDIEVVVVSSRTNVERKRFNLAHELAHRIIQNTRIPKAKPEKAMHRFGAAFLVPAEHLYSEVGQNRNGITWHELIRLKRFYGISAAAMLIRLKDVGLLPESTVEYAFRTYARSWRKEEPEPLRDAEGFGAFEKPMRYEELVYRALAEQLISPVRAAQLLKCSVATVEEQVRGPREQ
ncbi:MAG: helix-turn-helix domain-containing protein [bacterium]